MYTEHTQIHRDLGLLHEFAELAQSLSLLRLHLSPCLQESKRQLLCFQRLAEQEERTLPVRLEAAKARLARQVQRERELQETFKHKSLLRDDLTVKLAVKEKLESV